MANSKIGQIDTADIAAVALTVANAPSGHVGKAYDLTGPFAYSGEELAAALGAAAGHPVRYLDLVGQLVTGHAPRDFAAWAQANAAAFRAS